MILYHNLAAATVDHFYFPFGMPYGGTADDTGIFKNVILKEVKWWGLNSSLKLHGIEYQHLNLDRSLILGDGDERTEWWVGQGANLSHAWRLQTVGRDVKNLRITVENGHGSTAYTLYLAVTYEPIL
jgi:hypothetical protein